MQHVKHGFCYITPQNMTINILLLNLRKNGENQVLFNHIHLMGLPGILLWFYQEICIKLQFI